MSIGFYIRLRNDKGISGKRGERGDKGPKGFPGRCELNLDAKCGVKNCVSKIQDELGKRCNHYAEIVAKRDHDRSTEETQILESAVIARRTLSGELEPSRIREMPLAVLANQIISWTVCDKNVDKKTF